MFKNLRVQLKRKIKGRKKRRPSKKRVFSVKKGRVSRKTGSFDIRRIVVLAGVIICISVIVIWTVYCLHKVITFELKKAYKDSDEEITNIWHGDERLSILIIGMDKRDREFGFADMLVILMVDPEEQSVGIFNVNPDTQVFLSSIGKGVKLRNLYNYTLLELEEPPIDYMIDSIENMLSVNINRYIIVDEAGVEELTDVFGGVYVNNHKDIDDKDIVVENGNNFYLKEGNYRLGGLDFLHYCSADDDGLEHKFIRQNNSVEALIKRATSYITYIKLPFLLDTVSKTFYTDLTKGEILRLFIELSRIEEMKSSYMRLQSVERVSAKNDYVPIIEQLDLDVQKVFIDPKVGKEQARVEIFNSTNIRGLASLRARWLQNVGVDVIRVGDSPKVYDVTTVFTKELSSYPNTIDAVKKTFDEEIEVKEGEVPGIVTTGDVVIILGTNLNS